MTLERAIAIACKAHAGQVDKAGAPYVLHPIRVMLAMDTEAERIVAVLHDVVEDTEWTFDELQNEGFPPAVIAGIDAMTERKGEETYLEYIERAVSDPIGRKVKLADIADNMNPSRILNKTAKDYARLEKYRGALALIASIPITKA